MSPYEPKLTIQDASHILNISRQAVHVKLKKANTICEKISGISFLTHTTAKNLFSLRFKKKIIAVQHIKGGVGKTTTADTEGDFLSLLGAKVLKIDADFQKNLTSRYDISKKTLDETPVLIDLFNKKADVEDAIINVSEGVDLIPSRFENAAIDSILSSSDSNLENILKDTLSPITNNYDYIIFDCPAMLGKLVTAITLMSDVILCPINPEKYSMEGLETLKIELHRLEKIYNRKISYKVFLNKFESSTKLSNDADVIKLLEEEIKAGFAYDQAVKRSQEVKNALKKMQTVFGYVKKSDVRADFIDLGLQIIDFENTLSSSNSQGEK